MLLIGTTVCCCYTGCDKLGLAGGNGPFTACLEEDGTIIDKDDVLLQFTDKVVLLLGPDQQWHAPVTTSTPAPLQEHSAAVNGNQCINFL
jgi:hypothetical protein